MMNSKLLMGMRPGGRPRAPVVPVVLCAAILTLGALFFLWQRYQFVRLGFTVAELRQQKAVLEDVIEPLELEADYLSRPQRIEALARERLRMRRPLPSQVRILSAYDTDRF